MQSLMCISSLVHAPDVTEEGVFHWLIRLLMDGISDSHLAITKLY